MTNDMSFPDEAEAEAHADDADTPISHADWMAHLSRVGSGHGAFSRIGKDHLALFVEESDSLVISFDDAERVRTKTADGLPLGFEMVQRHEWSLLSVMASGPTWFRDPAIATFFDQLSDSGILDGYRKIVVVGLGPICGYAACAYSAIAPDARVLATSPVATLAARDTPFETRFGSARKLDFNGRFGHGPSMMRGARAALHIFDPIETLDAAQCALYRNANLTRIGLPHSAAYLDDIIHSGQTLCHLIRGLAEDVPRPANLRAILRKCWRRHTPYIERRIIAAQAAGHPARAAAFARHASVDLDDPRFAGLGSRLTETA